MFYVFIPICSVVASGILLVSKFFFFLKGRTERQLISQLKRLTDKENFAVGILRGRLL